jgi:hypothetical protein
MGGAVPPLPNTPSWRGAELGGAQRQLLPLPFGVSKHKMCQSIKFIYKDKDQVVPVL